MCPETVMSRAGDRRAPMPPAKSEPPQVVAAASPNATELAAEPNTIKARTPLAGVQGGGIVAKLGGNFDFLGRAVYAHFDGAIFAVDKRLVAVINNRVLGAGFLGDFLIALLDAVGIALRVEAAAGGLRVFGQE